jgi:hypothetical protein
VETPRGGSGDAAAAAGRATAMRRALGGRAHE